jgi:hypothetical protein
MANITTKRELDLTKQGPVMQMAAGVGGCNIMVGNEGTIHLVSIPSEEIIQMGLNMIRLGERSLMAAEAQKVRPIINGSAPQLVSNQRNGNGR